MTTYHFAKHVLLIEKKKTKLETTSYKKGVEDKGDNVRLSNDNSNKNKKINKT